MFRGSLPLSFIVDMSNRCQRQVALAGQPRAMGAARVWSGKAGEAITGEEI